MYLTGVITVVALLRVCGGESTVSLNRTTPSGLLSVCPDATAIFTCRVTGPNIIALNGTDYIGHDQVEFTRSSSEQGNHVRVLRGVVTLTKKSDNVLESQLLIHAARINSSIGCNSGHASSGKTMNLTVYNGFPGIPNDVWATEIPSSDGSCTILVDWDPPTNTPREDIKHYIVRDSVNGVHNETRDTRAAFRLSQCTKNFNVNVSTVDRCGQAGPPSNNVKPKHLQMPERNPATTANTSPTAISTTVIFALVIIICALAITLLTLIVYHCKGKYLTINDQDEVKNTVNVAQARWVNIGKNLGIHDDDLDYILNHHDDPEARLTAVLVTFLKRKKPKPTWKQLAEAMAKACADELG